MELNRKDPTTGNLRELNNITEVYCPKQWFQNKNNEFYILSKNELKGKIGIRNEIMLQIYTMSFNSMYKFKTLYRIDFNFICEGLLIQELLKTSCLRDKLFEAMVYIINVSHKSVETE